jgi:type IX secretion system substrate protein
MKYALVLAMLILSNISLTAQIQFISEIEGNKLYGMNNLQVKNSVIYFSDDYRYYRYSENETIILDKDDFDLKRPNIFLFYDDYVARDSRILISTTEGLFVQTNGNWRMYDHENSVLPTYYIYRFASDDNSVCMFTQDREGPYFLIADSIHAVDYDLHYEDSFSINSKRVVSLNGKYFFLSSGYHLIEIDLDGFERHDRELFADDPDDVYFYVNGGLTENNGKIWFTTSENYIVSFDGEKFEKDDTMKKYLAEQEHPTTTSAVLQDHSGNLWVYALVFPEAGNGWWEFLIIDKIKNVRTAFRSSDPEFTMQYKGLTNFTFDEVDKENQKAYFSVNNEYIGIYDPATDVLEVERIASMYFHKVYPNPIKHTANLEFYTSRRNLDAIRFECSDYLGKKLELVQPHISYDANTGKAQAELDFSAAQSGVYILSIMANGEAMSKLVIVE